MNKKKFISKMLSLPRPSIEYRIGEQLAKFFLEKAIIEGEEGGFDVEAYAQAGQCKLKQQTFLHNQLATYWIGPGPEAMHGHHMTMSSGSFVAIGAPMGIGQGTPGAEQETASRVRNAWLEVDWQGATLDVLFYGKPTRNAGFSHR